MKARIQKFLYGLSEAFWLVPGLMTLGGIVLALGLVMLDRRGIPAQHDLLDSPWLYSGGGTGARTLLGAIASSSIGVAGTVFSITIAALSLAAGQMGPRLLRNFTKDRGNQFTLGAFLATFAYSLMVLRTVRGEDQGDFVPHISLTVGIVLALVCVGTLVFFVGHMASRINVDTVIGLVSHDVRQAIESLAAEEEEAAPPEESFWRDASQIRDSRRGYLQQLDSEGLADWAREHGTAIRLLVRPGNYVFPGAPIAVMLPEVEGADEAVRSATALGSQRASSGDIEYAVRQLVEVAVRALSPGINDPHTALTVLDQLGAALCGIAPLYLRTGVVLRDDQLALVVPHVDYGGLTDAMFHLIRQNASKSPAVLIRMLEVLTAVASCEQTPQRLGALQRHADLVLGDARREILTPSDFADVQSRHEDFGAMLTSSADRAGMPAYAT